MTHNSGTLATQVGHTRRRYVDDQAVRINAPELAAAVAAREPETWAQWCAGGPAAFRRLYRKVVEPDGGSCEVALQLALHDRRGTAHIEWRRPDRRGAQRIEIVAVTYSRIRGQRWLWRCPVSDRLAERLYLPADAAGFGSRVGHALHYRTGTVTPADRARRKSERLRRLLGQDPPEVFGEMPPPPRRLHAVTYSLAVDEIRLAEAELAAALPSARDRPAGHSAAEATGR